MFYIVAEGASNVTPIARWQTGVASQSHEPDDDAGVEGDRSVHKQRDP